jgi:hypothetical protein
MTNNWIEHIKDFASKNNLSFGCALSNPECVKSYRQKKEPKKKIVLKLNKKPINEENEAKKREAEREAESIYKAYIGHIQGGMIIKNMTGKKTFNPVLKKHIEYNRNAYKRLTGKDLPSIEEVKKDIKKAEKQDLKNDKIREQKALEQKLKEPIDPNYVPYSVKYKKKIGVLL